MGRVRPSQVSGAGWTERLNARPAAQKALKAGETLRTTQLSDRSKAADDERAILFGQRARK